MRQYSPKHIHSPLHPLPKEAPPGVDVYYNPAAMTTGIAESIKQGVRSFGAKCFSTTALCLSEKDFSLKFHRASRFDELTNDIIVRIRLHDFPQRREALGDLDEAAKALAIYLMDDIWPALTSLNDRSLGVELMLTTIGWGASSTIRTEVST